MGREFFIPARTHRGIPVNTRDENAMAASDEQADGWYDGEGNETSQGNQTGNEITPGASWDNWAISE